MTRRRQSASVFVNSHQGIGKGPGIKGLQIVNLFTDPHEVDGKRPVAAGRGDGHQDTTLGGSVQFRDDEARQLCKGVEGFYLSEGILAVGTVHDQNHFVRRTFQGLCLRAADAA